MVSDELFVVGIASSAGGLEPLCELLGSAKCHRSMCFVVVPHISRTENSDLARILGTATDTEAKQIEDGMTLEHCVIYTIPPNQHVTVERGRLRLHPRPTHVPNQSADVFFKSLAAEYANNSIGVILSGGRVGEDGVEGIAAIKAAGGHTYAQDPGTAQFKDMPTMAIDSGHIDTVKSPAEIGDELSVISWTLP